jgi:hypothetical protein
MNPAPPPRATQPRLLSPSEVAERLNVSVSTARRIMRGLPHVRLGSGPGRPGGRLRIDLTVLEAWLEAQRVAPPGAVEFQRAPATEPRFGVARSPTTTAAARQADLRAWLAGGRP